NTPKFNENTLLLGNESSCALAHIFFFIKIYSHKPDVFQKLDCNHATQNYRDFVLDRRLSIRIHVHVCSMDIIFQSEAIIFSGN
ncbi:MAG: hypothetical protein ACR2HL_02915, partial [Methylocystis sp.]